MLILFPLNGRIFYHSVTSQKLGCYSGGCNQCTKGFLPRLFFAFCLGSGTEAYRGEA